MLGNYIIRAEPNTDAYLPTYHSSTVVWQFASTIELRENLDDVNINLQSELPELPLQVGDDNVIRGYLELDTDNFPPGTFAEGTPGGRTEARRRVRKAGVSFNRARFVNRAEETIYELIAYVLTDENGEYEVPDLPDGQYQIIFDFPGIPTDTASYEDFNLGQDGEVDENEITVVGEVTPLGILVEKVEETGIYRHYFKDLKLFPIPADDHLEITYERLNTEGIIMQVVNLAGARLIEQEIPRGFNQQVSLDVSALKPGYYLITFMDKERGIRSITTLKFVIQR